jgi:histidinol-phosphate phosphatase family protein
VAFIDDDVEVPPDWAARLVADLEAAAPHVAGVQGRIRVPLPAGRRPTDWERNVAGLERAMWPTADMAYRRAVLQAVGGFDERFPRAYREDADLAQRVLDAGYQLVAGDREVVHPVRPASRWISVRQQRGNADDALMQALHGADWEGRPSGGRRPRHLVTAAFGALAVYGFLTKRRASARLGTAGWLVGTGELAWARIEPGPRTADEIVTMVATSVAIPFAATWHWFAGLVRRGRLLRDAVRAPVPGPRVRPHAVLFDRDGTLIIDVPYNGDPDKVRAMPGAAEALARLRAAGILTAVISNQSGVARALITADDVDAVNSRIEELLGPIGPWIVCHHGPDDGCSCRKPAPGMVIAAAEQLGVDPARVAVIGDIGADVEAALAAGARGVLVPNDATRHEEVAAAPEVAPDLVGAVDLLLGESA